MATSAPILPGVRPRTEGTGRGSCSPSPVRLCTGVSAFELDTSVGAGEGAALCTVECPALEMAPVWLTSPKGTLPLTLPCSGHRLVPAGVPGCWCWARASASPPGGIVPSRADWPGALTSYLGPALCGPFHLGSTLSTLISAPSTGMACAWLQPPPSPRRDGWSTPEALPEPEFHQAAWGC